MLAETTTKYLRLWQLAQSEARPDPNGAAGDLMQAFAEILDAELVEFDQVGGAALFLFNLGSLGFKGMDMNVAMVTHPPSNSAERDEQERLLSDYRYAVKSIGFCFHVVLQDEPAAPMGQPPSGEIVRLSGEDFERLFRSQAPSAVLFAALRRQVKLNRLCPFNTSHEARGGMFFGRADELDRLVSERDTNFLVTGARMIGKTSLLKRARSVQMQQSALRERVFYFDCSVWGGLWDCLLRLVNAIDLSRERRLEQNYDLRQVSYLLKRKSANGRRPYILLLDECDALVDQESQHGWPFTSFLHEATKNGWVQVTFAGYRSTPNLITAKDSPFHNRLARLGLGALGQGEAEDLLRKPLLNAGIQMDDQNEIVRRVVTGSARQPFLIQFYGERLFQAAAGRSPNRVEPADVDLIDDSDDLSRFHKKHFLLSTEQRGRPCPDERICALALAHSAADDWPQQEFELAARTMGHNMTMDQTDDALTHMCDARVLKVTGRRYSFTYPLLKSILKADYPNVQSEVESLLRGV